MAYSLRFHRIYICDFWTWNNTWQNPFLHKLKLKLILFLCVKWDLPFEIWVRRRTCQGCSMCYKGKFLKCLNDAICGPWIRARVVVKDGATREQKVHPRCITVFFFQNGEPELFPKLEKIGACGGLFKRINIFLHIIVPLHSGIIW